MSNVENEKVTIKKSFFLLNLSKSSDLNSTHLTISKLKLFSKIQFHFFKGLIKFGCEMGCHKIENLCKNGGHCLVEWMATKNDENSVSCNCARTSYYGEYCDEGRFCEV